jgi:hypothetical protein
VADFIAMDVVEEGGGDGIAGVVEGLGVDAGEIEGGLFEGEGEAGDVIEGGLHAGEETPEMAGNGEFTEVDAAGEHPVAIPAGVLLFVLRDPIIGLAFQRGAFSAIDAANTSRALAGFSIGLVGFSVYMFVLRAFYAHRDTRTPFIINVAENLLNIAIAMVLVARFGVLGLGLAFAIAYLMSAIGAIRILGNKVTGFPVSAVLLSIARMLLAGVVMAEVIWLFTRSIGDTTGPGALWRILVGTVIGVTVYLGALTVMRAPEAKQIISTVAAPIIRATRQDRRGG